MLYNIDIEYLMKLADLPTEVEKNVRDYFAGCEVEDFSLTLEGYEQSVREDIQDYFKDNGYLDDFKDPDYNWGEQEFWSILDDVRMVATGNDDGSYYCNTWKAKKALEGVIFDPDFHELLSNWGSSDTFWRAIQEEQYETADVIVREVVAWNLEGNIQEWLEGEIDRELD